MKNTLLIIDDEIYIVESLKRLLGKEGYDILTATSGLEGLKLIQSHSVQVVLCDQRMPTMSGTEFVKQVHALYPDTPCIILSAYIDFEALKEAVNEGAIFKFISKPWQDNVVLTYVQNAFTLQAERVKRHPPVNQLVHHDALTGLPNRYSFYESLERRIVEARKTKEQFAIVCFDINRFIRINALIGPQKADLLLQRLAKRLRNFVAVEHDLARMGNDEFVLLISEAGNTTKLISMINRLSALIKKPTSVEGKQYRLTASIGISIYPVHGDKALLLMQHTGAALEFSKKAGVDNFQFYKPEMEFNNEAQSFSIDEIYQAIGRKQFTAHYQPIYSMNKHKIVGVEALIRWQHPKKGLLLPGKFLAFCEETNLIIPIGAGILRAACQQVKLWRDLGYPDLTLAVNLSVNQINHPLFLDLVVDVLNTTQLPPSSLVLEVTETLLMQNTQMIITLLNALQGIGVKLSLDDFGTGYSSLSYLRKFPFNSLKIDQSFITGMTATAAAEAIVDTIIALGKILKLQIIAEGVETEEQLDLLQKKQCDFLQGFLFSKPLAARDFEQLLLKQKTKKPCA